MFREYQGDGVCAGRARAARFEVSRQGVECAVGLGLKQLRSTAHSQTPRLQLRPARNVARQTRCLGRRIQHTP